LKENQRTEKNHRGKLSSQQKKESFYNINQARFFCQHYDSFGPFEAGIHHNKTTPVNDKIIK
jgi:hypothetical protein